MSGTIPYASLYIRSVNLQLYTQVRLTRDGR